MLEKLPNPYNSIGQPKNGDIKKIGNRGATVVPVGKRGKTPIGRRGKK